MNTTTHQNQHTHPELDDGSNVVDSFAQSVELLSTKTKAIPSGWRRGYQGAVRELEGLQCERRVDLCVSGPWVASGEIGFVLSRPDRCVEGWVRRTAARLQSTCEICGRGGRRRLLGFRTRVLCAACFAPLSLERDLEYLIGRGESGAPTFHFETDLGERVRALFDERGWRVQRDGNGQALRYVLREDVVDASKQLARLQRR